MAPQSILCSLHFQLLMNRAVLQQINFKRTVFPRKNSSPFWEKSCFERDYASAKTTPDKKCNLLREWMARLSEHMMLRHFAIRDTSQCLVGISLSASCNIFRVPPPILQRELKMNHVALTTRLQWENVSSFVFMGASNSSVPMTCCL